MLYDVIIIRMSFVYRYVRIVQDRLQQLVTGRVKMQGSTEEWNTQVQKTKLQGGKCKYGKCT